MNPNSAQAAFDGRNVSPSAPRSPVELYSDFLSGLGRAVKCNSLYKASHPLTLECMKEVVDQLEKSISQTRAEKLTLAASGERWTVNGLRTLEAPQAREMLLMFFADYGLQRLTFVPGLRIYELSALCALASRPAYLSDKMTFEDFLSQMGVKHILHERSSGPRAADAPAEIPPPAAPAAEPSPAPFPPPAPGAAPAARLSPDAAARKFSGLSFGPLLKALVESAVDDPDERAHVYQDAFGLVKDALDRHVAQATETLHREKRRILSEQERTEQVLSTVADGKVIVDKDGNILMMNRAAEEISGKRLADVAGKHISESVNPGEQMVAMSADIELPPDGALSKDIRVIAQAEVERALKSSLALVQDDAGRVVGTYAVLPDVAKFKEAVKMQEEFLSRVTHDLKAPLSSLNCGLELIASRLGPRLGPEESGMIDICLRNSRQLGRMIGEILDFSKMESGQMAVRCVETSAGPLIREAVEGLGPWAKTKGLTLEAAALEPELAILADGVRVVQILTNLISNAIKSTPAGGRITVSARPGQGPDAGRAVLSVRDTGCGISPADIERIFEKFIQLDAPGHRKEGVGLGLTIVQELVRMHQGRVWVDSAPGKGSTFSFTLPFAADPLLSARRNPS